MKQPLWKRLLSYFIELHIESTSSEYNPHLYVSLNQGRYQLCTENAIYSFDDLYDNYSDAFRMIKLDELPIQKVLILGFGLGSIPLILEKTFKKNYHYTGIEIDEEVIYLASKYTLPKLSSPTQLICADAELWMNQCQEQFDLITVDLFLDDVIPVVFEQIKFLEGLKKILSPKGILLYNRLAYTPNDVEKARAFYNEKFASVFNSGQYLEVKGNWILINNKEVVK